MADVKTTCRDIDELSPTAKQACLLFFQECHKAGIVIFITETYRSQERQDYLYAQGRTRSGNIVTWTKTSRHKSRLAWDIAASTLNGNKDIYNTSIIKKAGAIAMKLGITWGGQPSWIKAGATDYPHFEVDSNWKIPNGYKLEGKVSIPTSSASPITIVSSTSKLPQVELKVDDTKNTVILDNVKDYSKSIGKNYSSGNSVFRIHTIAFPSKVDADLACKTYVENGYFRYAEVFGNDKDGYRLQSGKYTTEEEVEDDCIKILDSKVTTYLSIIGATK